MSSKRQLRNTSPKNYRFTRNYTKPEIPNKYYQSPPHDAQTNEEIEDYYIEQWERTQISKASVDNTINAIIDAKDPMFYRFTFFEDSEDETELKIEEGVQMAILSHGLQPNMSNKLEHSFGERPAKRYCTEASEQTDEVTDRTLFMNKAVSVAIQEKGLVPQHDL